jgi:hypothetical protein
MDSLRMTGKADLKVFYDADIRMYDPAWLAAHGTTEAAFIARYCDCPSVGFEQGGIPFGGVILDGNDAHIAILPEFHGKWATLLQPALAWLFSQRSEVRGKVHRLNRHALRFNRRLGGKLVGSDDNFYFFSLTPEGVASVLRPSRRPEPA